MNDSVVMAALKALSNETKALIMVSELGARRMPSFQLRTIFNAIVKDEDERRIIVDLIDKEMRASGFPEDRVYSLLNDLLSVPNPLQQMNDMQSTRRLRSPFAQNFEGQMPAQTGAGFDAQNGAPLVGAVQFNPRSSPFAGGQGEPQRPEQRANSQFFKGQQEESERERGQPIRSGSFPPASGAGVPSRLSPSRDPAQSGIEQNPLRAAPAPNVRTEGSGAGAESRNGLALPLPAATRYSQNAFSHPDDNPALQVPARPTGFSKNSYAPLLNPAGAGVAAPGLPGLPGMPPVIVRPQQASTMPAHNPAEMPPPSPSRRAQPDNRLSDSATAQAVSEASMLTPGLAGINGPMASKIVSRTDGSPNYFQGGVSTMSGRNNDDRPIVLIADDDKRIRMVFRLRMEESGLTVVECADGSEAWERIQQGDITLAVLDMKMPGLHGLEVLSRMADKQYRIPVIVCSAYDQLKDEFVVQTYPKLRYLVKPVAPEQLVGSIKELLVKQTA